MKKILLIITALCAVTVLNAESRDALLSKIQKAKADTQNEKKNTKPTTWIALGEAYLNGYTAIKGDAWTGAQQVEVKLVMGDQKIISSETVTLNDAQYTVDRYEDKDLYYNAAGTLEFVNVTKPLMNEDILALAAENYLKAASLDSKGQKKKDISDALVKIHDNYTADAWAAYVLGDMSKAASLFEAALPAFNNPVVSRTDTLSTYFAAVINNAAGNTAKAKELYKACFAMGYDQEGNGHSTMAEILKKEGDIEGAKALLNEGFQAYPSSQAILVSLINLYMETKDDPNKVIELIHTAQANEPGNASLYYAEGNVYKQLGDLDKAEELYNKSYEVNNDYIYGVYEVGNMYLNKAVDIQTAMDALDVNDVKGYEKLRADFDDMLVKCIPPFEKAFEMAKADDVKKAAAQALKQVYFVFRDKGAEYQAGYDKYSKYLGE